MPKGIPLTEEELARCRHQIFHQVVKIFVKKGFHETSMQEIAAAAGLGKSTLYDYFKTKDEFLVNFFEDQWNDVIEEAQKIAVQNCGVDVRLTSTAASISPLMWEVHQVVASLNRASSTAHRGSCGNLGIRSFIIAACHAKVAVTTAC